jgi:hypothetical protein
MNRRNEPRRGICAGAQYRPCCSRQSRQLRPFWNARWMWPMEQHRTLLDVSQRRGRPLARHVPGRLRAGCLGGVDAGAHGLLDRTGTTGDGSGRCEWEPQQFLSQSPASPSFCLATPSGPSTLAGMGPWIRSDRIARREGGAFYLLFWLVGGPAGASSMSSLVHSLSHAPGGSSFTTRPLCDDPQPFLQRRDVGYSHVLQHSTAQHSLQVLTQNTSSSSGSCGSC